MKAVATLVDVIPLQRRALQLVAELCTAVIRSATALGTAVHGFAVSIASLYAAMPLGVPDET